MYIQAGRISVLPGGLLRRRRGLFGSIPSLEGEETRLPPIEGELPDPTALPEGCAFHPRCPHCTERCRTAQPPEFKCGTHMVRCILFEKEEGYREQ